MKKYKAIEDDLINLVEEPSASYGIENSVLSNSMALIELIQGGISFSFFEKLKSKLPFNEVEWAELLGISSKSLNRYKNSKGFIFKPLQSEKLIEISEVTKLGMQVFGNKEAFFEWLHFKSPALGFKSPFELLPSSYGKNLVIAELHKIEHGIFA